MAPNPAYDPIISEASRRYGVPEDTIRSVMRVESGGRERAVSPKGASGLMQVLPETYNELARKHGLGPDRFDPTNNIMAGTAYIRENYERFGNWTDALSAYNAGPGRVQRVKDGRSTMPAETQAYVPNVQGGMSGGLTRESVVNELKRRGKLPPEYDTPAPQALSRESVIAELQRRGKLPPTPTPAGDSSTVSSLGEAWRGLQTGVDQLQGGIGYGLEVLGDKTGWQGLEDYGQGIRERNAVEQKQTPARVGRVEDIHSVGDFSDWAAYTIGTLGPQVGAALAASVAAALAAPAVGVSAGVAGLTAAGLVSLPMNGSEVFQNLLDKGVDRDTAMNISMAAAVPMAALDAIVPGKAAGRVVGNAVTHAVAPTLAGKIAQGGVRVLKDMGMESGTETLQEAGGIAAEAYAGVAPTVQEGLSRLANAGAAGAIGGAGVGVATAPFEGGAPPPPPAPGTVPPAAPVPPVTPGPTAPPAPPPTTATPPIPGYRPFLDQDGSLIGWQSPDGSTVVAADAPIPPTAPDLRTELNQVVNSDQPVESIVAGNDLHRPLAGEIPMDGLDPDTGEEEHGFYHEETGRWRAAGDPPTSIDSIGMPPVAPVAPVQSDANTLQTPPNTDPLQPVPTINPALSEPAPVELPPIPPEVQAAADRSQEQLAVKGTSTETPSPEQSPTSGPAPGFVRMYHGGLTAAQDAPTWFSSDRRYAEGYAAKNGRTDGGLLYVDVPEDHPLIAPEWADQSVANGFTVNTELPAELARMAQPVPDFKGTSAETPSPLTPEEAFYQSLDAASTPEEAARLYREWQQNQVGRVEITDADTPTTGREHIVREGNQRPPPPPRPALPGEPFRAPLPENPPVSEGISDNAERTRRLKAIADRYEAIGNEDRAEWFRNKATQPPGKYDNLDGWDRMVKHDEERAAGLHTATQPPRRGPVAPPKPVDNIDTEIIVADEESRLAENIAEGVKHVPAAIRKAATDRLNDLIRLRAERGYNGEDEPPSHMKPHAIDKIDTLRSNLMAAYNRYVRFLGALKLGRRQAKYKDGKTEPLYTPETVARELANLQKLLDAPMPTDADLAMDFSGYDVFQLDKHARTYGATGEDGAAALAELRKRPGWGNRRPLDLVKERQGIIKKLRDEKSPERYAELEAQAASIEEDLARDPAWENYFKYNHDRTTGRFENLTPRQWADYNKGLAEKESKRGEGLKTKKAKATSEARAAESAAAAERLKARIPETAKRPFPQTVSMVEKDLRDRKTKPNVPTIARQYDLGEEEAAKVLASIAGRGSSVIRQVQASRKERGAQARGEGTAMTAPRYRLAPRSAGPQTLIGLLASKGGLAPNGDLSAMDLDKVRTPGNGGMLVRKGGMTLDQARELAEEEGLIGSSDDYQTSDIQELLDAIEDEHRGSKVTESRADRHGPERQQMEAFARSLGIEVQDDWSDVELLTEIGEADAVRRGDPSLSADIDEATIQAMLDEMGIFDRSIFSTAELTDFDIPFPDVTDGIAAPERSEVEVASSAGGPAEESRQDPEGQAGGVRQGDSAPEARPGEPDTGSPGGVQNPTPRVEKTDQGDQYVFGGEAGQRTKMPTLKGKVPQEPADEGLFADKKEPEPEPQQLDIEGPQPNKHGVFEKDKVGFFFKHKGVDAKINHVKFENGYRGAVSYSFKTGSMRAGSSPITTSDELYPTLDDLHKALLPELTKVAEDVLADKSSTVSQTQLQAARALRAFVQSQLDEYAPTKVLGERAGPEFDEVVKGPAEEVQNPTKIPTETPRNSDAQKPPKNPPKISEIKASDLAGLDEASIDALLDEAFGGEPAAVPDSPKPAQKEPENISAARALFDKHFQHFTGQDELFPIVEAFVTGQEDFATTRTALQTTIRESDTWRESGGQKKAASSLADNRLRALRTDMKERGLSTKKAPPKLDAAPRINVPAAVARANAAVEAGTATDLEREIYTLARDIKRRRADQARLAKEARETKAIWKAGPTDRLMLGGLAGSTIRMDSAMKERDRNLRLRQEAEEKLKKLVAKYAPPAAPKTEGGPPPAQRKIAEMLKPGDVVTAGGATRYVVVEVRHEQKGGKWTTTVVARQDGYPEGQSVFYSKFTDLRVEKGLILYPYGNAVIKKVEEDGKQESKKDSKPPSEQSAADILKAAGAAGVKGADEALTGLYKLFGGNKLSSGFTFDEDTYKAAKPHFQAAYKSFAEAGRSLLDFARFIQSNFGDQAKPYLKRFLTEGAQAKVDAQDEPVAPPPTPEPEPAPAPKIDKEIDGKTDKLTARQIDGAKARLREIGQALNSAIRDRNSDAHEVAELGREARSLARSLVEKGGQSWADINDTMRFIGDQETSAGLGIHLAEDGWKFTYREFDKGLSATTTHATFGEAFAALRRAKDAVNKKAVGKEPEGTPAVEPAPDPAPGTDKPTGERVDGASVLASHGIKVTKVVTRKGKPAWEVTGNTRPLNEWFKSLPKGKKPSWWEPKKAWTFWHEEDPTEAIAAKLRGEEAEGAPAPTGGTQQPQGVAGERPGNNPRPRRRSSSDARLRAVRQREDARNDERPNAGDARSWVEQETQELIRRGLKFGMPEEVVSQQIEDVGLIHRAYANGKKLFLLANEAGTGKTFVLGGAIRELRRSGAENIVYVTMNQDLITQIKKDLEPYGIGDVKFYTYSDLSKNAPALEENTVLIFDETQSIKDPSSSRGKSGQQMIAQARFTLFASATPFENPVQAKYLQATGIFDSVGGHTDFAKMYGASVKKIESFNYKTGKKEVVEIPYWQGGKSEDGIAARTWFMRQGIMTQRAKKLPPGMVDSTFRKSDVPKEWLDKYESVEAAYTAALNEYKTPDGRPVNSKIFSMISMHRINMIKRILEASKVGEAIARAKVHLADGKQVVIFVETKADREVGKFRKTGDSSGPVYSYPEMAQLMQRWEMTRKQSDDPPPFSDAILAIALAMHNLGVSFTLPSTSDEIVKALGKENVAIYTGAVSTGAASKSKADFLAKRKSVLVATMAKGGTGLSLHDTVGDSPRVQIGLNLPWVASAVDQVSGRIARYGLQSKALIEWLFAGNVPFEQSLAQRVGARMRDMGALVKGIDLQAASILTEFNLEEETFLPEEGQAAEVKGEEAGKEPTRAELLAMAEKLEKARRKLDDTSGGAFFTPYPLAVAMRFISGVFAGDRVLEPSAGHGALVRFLPGNLTVDMVERRMLHVAELQKLFGKKEGYNVVEGDFLELADLSEDGYDTILMNPPFERLAGIGPQDIAHVRKAYDLLLEGGRLVAIMGEGPFFREQKSDADFRDWLEQRGAVVVKLPDNTFKNSGTGVNARLVVIDEGAQPGRTDINLHDVDTAGLNTLINAIPVRERDRHGARFDYAQDDGSGIPMPDVPLPGSLDAGQTRFFFDGDVGGDFTQLTSRTTGFNVVSYQPEFEQARERVAKAIGELAERIGGGKMPVQVFDRLFFRPQDKAGPVVVAGAQVRQGPFAGLVALAMSAPDIHGTLRHEAIHWLREAGLLDGADWRALERHAAEWRKQFFIDERYGADLSAEILDEEGIAEAYKAWANGELEAKGPVARAFQKLKRFLEAVRNLLAGNGFTTANSIFQKIETGEMARADARANSETAGDRGAATAGAVGEGARFMLPPPRQGNLGQPYGGQGPAPAAHRPAPAAPVNQGHLFSVRTHLPDRSMVDWLTDANQTLIDRIKGASSKAAIGVTVDRLRQLTQDKYIRLQRVQEAVATGTGRVVPQAENAYLSEELSSSKAMEKMFRVDRDHKKPILQAIHAAKLTVEQVEKYLYARHAPERNARIGQINPRFAPGEGSGMTDADAAGIINAFRVQGILPQLDHIAGLVDAMVSATLDERVASGLMSAQDALRWRQTYRHYVPLRGIKELDDSAPARPQGGQGYNVRGHESQRALGRKSRAEDSILSGIFMQSDEAIIRGEKNNVLLTLLNLVQNAVDPDYWVVDKVTVKPIFNKATGLVETRATTKLSREEEDRTVRLKVNGHEHRITIFDGRLMKALKNPEANKVNMLVAAMMKVNRFLSTVNTGLNPEFFITNAFRDIQAGFINMNAADLRGLQASVLRDYGKALLGAWHGVRGNNHTVWARHFRDFAAAGGRVSFYAVDDLDQHRTKIEAELKRMKGGTRNASLNGLKATFKFIGDANAAVDNGIRLATYVNAKRLGKTDAEAASLAKNLTINFNRHGELGPVLNAAYLFYNAGVQGTAILFKALRHKRVRKIAGGIIVMGFMMEMLNAWTSPDDDDGEKVYDKMSDFVKSRNFVLMFPDKTALTLTMPYGYNVFADLGRNLAAFVRGHQTIGTTLGNILQTGLDAFNPIGGSNSLLNFLAPTVLDPLVDLTTNRDFAGRKISPETPNDKSVPDSQKFSPNTWFLYRDTARFLNELSGGNEFRGGGIDVSPETLEYWANWVLGGAGAFALRSGSLVTKFINGDEVVMNDIPFARKVITRKGPGVDQNLFYERAEQIEALQKERKGLGKLGRKGEADQIKIDDGDLLRLAGAAGKIRENLATLRRKRNGIQADGSLTREERIKRLNEVKEREKRQIDHFNAAYVAKVLKPRQQARALIHVD